MIRTALIATPALLWCAACAPTVSADNQSVPTEPLLHDGPDRTPDGAACTSDGLDDLIGQQGSSSLAAEAMKRSGAQKLRWMQPGTMATMDYRTDRLNIELDGNNVVTGFKCG
tara:strand:- start:373 stop:711 length:339 start_codon:yes stop_codon:yes gene_type:complete